MLFVRSVVKTAMQKYPVIIIGAGPAGLTTALQLKRVNIPALVFESGRIGGLLHNANLVENYLGFPHGVTGPRLVKLLKKQAEYIGVEVVAERVTLLEHDGENFIVKTDISDHRAKIAVVASGTKPRQFEDGLIPENAKERVFYEVYDLLDVINKRIVIVGTGDAAFDYALNLARQNRVTILNRGKHVKALELLQERTQKNGNISYRDEIHMTQVANSGEGTLSLQLTGPAGVERTEADFLMGALGRIPQLDFLAPNIHQKENELIERGILYFAGDVRNGVFRQTAIAAGDGLRTAMQIDQSLKETR